MNIKQIVYEVIFKVFGSSEEYLSKEKEIEQAIEEAFKVDDVEEMIKN